MNKEEIIKLLKDCKFPIKYINEDVSEGNILLNRIDLMIEKLQSMKELVEIIILCPMCKSSNILFKNDISRNECLECGIIF